MTFRKCIVAYGHSGGGEGKAWGKRGDNFILEEERAKLRDKEGKSEEWTLLWVKKKSKDLLRRLSTLCSLGYTTCILRNVKYPKKKKVAPNSPVLNH